jgi:hypothetical protein
MNDFETQWQKLAALARQAPVDPAGAAPLGFAARIVARMESRPLPAWSVFERFALRGFLAAVSCCVAAMAFHYFNLGAESLDESGLDDVTMTAAIDVS